MILYKYTGREGMKKSISGASLLVRPLNEFNDPFESVPAISDEALRLLAEETFETASAQQWLSAHPDFVGEELTIPRLQARLRESTFRHELADKLARRTRATQTLLQIAVYFQDHFSTRTGLVCLTKNPNSILMWSHYAEEHRGFLFSLDTSLWEHDGFTPVAYSNTRVSYAGRSAAAELMPIFMTKSLAWKYEEECRSLCKVDSWKVVGDSKQDFLSLEPQQIGWICAGVRTLKDDIEEVRSALKDSPFPNAEVYQASLHQSEFRIQLPKECAVSSI